MTKFIGRLVDLGIARETARGTGIAPDMWLPKVDFSFDDAVTKARVLSGVGSISDSQQAHVTTKYGEGDLGAEIRDQSFGFILYALLGSLSTAADTPEVDTHTHSFSLDNTNQHDSLTFVVKDPNTTEMYKLVMLDSLEITAALDEVVSFSAGFLSKTSVGSSGTASYTDENKFTKKHLTLKVADALGGLSGASALSVKSLSLTFSKNAILDDVLGTAEPEDILNQTLAIEGEITLNYEDETWKNYMLDNNEKAMMVKFENTDVTIGTTTNPSLELRFPKVDFFDWTPDYALDDIVSQTISFKASKDVANDNEIISTCDLINTKASY